MKVCAICGCHNADNARSCSVCGVRFPEVSSPVAVSAPAPAAGPVYTSVPSPVPAPIPVPVRKEHAKSDRMALAGFILSLMGSFTCVTSPLQLTALILCCCAGKTGRFRALRLMGIILSAAALGISLILWLVFSLNSDGILSYITEILSKFYY